MHLEIGRACPQRVHTRIVKSTKTVNNPKPSVKLSVRPATISANRPDVDQM